MPNAPEIYVAADIEADGPIPGAYSMISLGLAAVGFPDRTFYTELKPISADFVPAALAVSGLDRERLKREAPDARSAMKGAAEWIDSLSDLGKPVLVAAPAVFDGMFLHWYFIRFVGRSPFAVNGAGIDLRSFWMGATGSSWVATGRTAIQQALGIRGLRHTHHALDDARELAEIFQAALRERGGKAL
jgi:DNA polymerase III epsilon subunit-like protein